MHLVGFIIRIYHDARSTEHKKYTKLLFTVMFEISVAFFGHVIHSNGKDSRCLSIVFELLCESETKGLN